MNESGNPAYDATVKTLMEDQSVSQEVAEAMIAEMMAEGAPTLDRLAALELNIGRVVTFGVRLVVAAAFVALFAFLIVTVWNGVWDLLEGIG